MNRLVRFSLAASLCATGVLHLAGCEMRGGGWIPVPGGKATFGFTIQCDEETGDVTGQFQYHDHAAGVSIHGDFQDTLLGFDDCRVISDEAAFMGEYWAQPNGEGETGTFVLHVSDDGDRGASKDDYLELVLVGGPYSGYSRSGWLRGGNIRSDAYKGNGGGSGPTSTE